MSIFGFSGTIPIIDILVFTILVFTILAFTILVFTILDFNYSVITYRHALHAGSSDLHELRRLLGSGGRGADPRSVPIVDYAVVLQD
jgi:ABC-type nitrate/sulfonate/bicarbonate transport system permease component